MGESAHVLYEVIHSPKLEDTDRAWLYIDLGATVDASLPWLGLVRSGWPRERRATRMRRAHGVQRRRRWKSAGA